jgi:hypothetical protein
MFRKQGLVTFKEGCCSENASTLFKVVGGRFTRGQRRNACQDIGNDSGTNCVVGELQLS